MVECGMILERREQTQVYFAAQTLILFHYAGNKADEKNLTPYICIKFRKTKMNRRELIIFLHYRVKG